MGTFKESATGTLSPTGIPSRQAFGTPTITLVSEFLYPSSVPSRRAFGHPSMAQAQTVTVTSVPSRRGIGTPTVTFPALAQTISPSGIPSRRAFGTSGVISGGSQTVLARGIPSRRAFGSPALLQNDTQPLRVFVAGKNTFLASSTCTYDRRMFGRSTASFQLQWPEGSNPIWPRPGQSVRITENYRRLFSGFLQEVSKEIEPETSFYRFDCTCVDLGVIADRRTVDATCPAGPVRPFILSMFAQFAGGDGLSTDNVTTTSTIAKDRNFPQKTLAEMMNQLCSETGDVWFIDELGVVNCFSPGNYPVSSLVLNTSNLFAGLKVKETLIGVATQIFVRSNQNFGAEPILHSESFVMDGTAAFIRTAFPIAYHPISFTINGVETPLLTEFVDPINPTRWFWNPDDTIIFHGGIVAPAAGTILAITYESSSSNLVSVISGTADILSNINDPQTSDIEDPPDPTYDYIPFQPSGVIQRVVDIPGITDAASAQAIATGIARRASVVPIALSGSTEQPDLKPGYKITAYLPEYDASGEYVITSISAKADEVDLGFGTCFRTSFEAVILQDAPDQEPPDTQGEGTSVISSAYPIYQQAPLEALKTAVALQPAPGQFEKLSIVLGDGGSLVAGSPLGNIYPVQHTGTLLRFQAIAATPPESQTLVIDVFCNGVSIFGATKLEIGSDATSLVTSNRFFGYPVPARVNRGDLLTFSAEYRTGTGSLEPAANVTVIGEWYF